MIPVLFSHITVTGKTGEPVSITLASFPGGSSNVTCQAASGEISEVRSGLTQVVIS